MEERVISITAPLQDHSITENMKSIRTNIIYSGENKVIAVSSSVPGEGKSTVAVQLALSFAMLNKKTILVECDMRKPSLRKLLSIKGSVSGISEYLTSQTSEFIYATNVKNLHMILAGKVPPNSAELLASPKMSRLIEALKEHYDYIILDTPPVSGAVDIQILGPMADGVLLVSRANFSRVSVTRRCVESLRRNNIRILGSVLNGVNSKDNGYGYYYYDYYY